MSADDDPTICGVCFEPFDDFSNGRHAPITSPSCCGNAVCRLCVSRSYEAKQQGKPYSKRSKYFSCPVCSTSRAFHIDKIPSPHIGFLSMITQARRAKEDVVLAAQELINRADDAAAREIRDLAEAAEQRGVAAEKKAAADQVLAAQQRQAAAAAAVLVREQARAAEIEARAQQIAETAIAVRSAAEAEVSNRLMAEMVVKAVGAQREREVKERKAITEESLRRQAEVVQAQLDGSAGNRGTEDHGKGAEGSDEGGGARGMDGTVVGSALSAGDERPILYRYGCGMKFDLSQGKEAPLDLNDARAPAVESPTHNRPNKKPQQTNHSSLWPELGTRKALPESTLRDDLSGDCPVIISPVHGRLPCWHEHQDYECFSSTLQRTHPTDEATDRNNNKDILAGIKGLDLKCQKSSVVN
jgi:hypothetical protein